MPAMLSWIALDMSSRAASKLELQSTELLQAQMLRVTYHLRSRISREALQMGTTAGALMDREMALSICKDSSLRQRELTPTSSACDLLS